MTGELHICVCTTSTQIKTAQWLSAALFLLPSVTAELLLFSRKKEKEKKTELIVELRKKGRSERGQEKGGQASNVSTNLSPLFSPTKKSHTHTKWRVITLPFERLDEPSACGKCIVSHHPPRQLYSDFTSRRLRELKVILVA